MSTPTWRSRIREHEAAAMFPLLAETAPDELRELADDIKKNGIQQPIVLWSPTRFPGRDPKEKYLLDGRNRLDALELAFADDPERLAEKIDDALYPDPENGARLLGGEVDPWDFVISANAHRRHLTRDQKRELVEKLLKARPERSDRATARLAGFSDKTVGGIRRTLERRAEIPHVESRTDAVGRQQPASKPPPPLSKEAQIRWLREREAEAPAQTAAQGGTGNGHDANDAVEAQKLLGLLDYLTTNTPRIKLAAARRGLDPVQLDRAWSRHSLALDWLRQVEIALRGDE
jgi:ParB-like chromosome segregation protein Spo0J